MYKANKGKKRREKRREMELITKRGENYLLSAAFGRRSLDMSADQLVPPCLPPLLLAFAISIKMPYIMELELELLLELELPLRTSNAIKIKCSAPFLNQSKS